MAPMQTESGGEGSRSVNSLKNQQGQHHYNGQGQDHHNGQDQDHYNDQGQDHHNGQGQDHYNGQDQDLQVTIEKRVQPQPLANTSVPSIDTLEINQ